MAVDPIPNNSYVPKPPLAPNDLDELWRKGVYDAVSDTRQWPRVPHQIYDRAPTTADDQTFGYQVGFLWLGVVAEEGPPG